MREAGSTLAGLTLWHAERWWGHRRTPNDITFFDEPRPELVLVSMSIEGDANDISL